MIAATCWTMLNSYVHGERAARQQDAVNVITDKIEHDIGARIGGIQHIVEQWLQAGGMDAASFHSDAGRFLRDHPGIQAISFSDTQHIVRLSVPPGPEPPTGLKMTDGDRMRAQAFRDAEQSQAVQLIGPLDLINDQGPGLLLVFPMVKNGAFVGNLNLVMAVEPWMTVLAADLRRSRISADIPFELYSGETRLFRTSLWNPAIDGRTAIAEIKMFGLKFSIVGQDIAGVGATGLMIRNGATAAITLLCLLLVWLEWTARSADVAIARQAELLVAADEAARAMEQEIQIRTRAEQKALGAAAMKSRFIANMSHEIRTPLNAIMGMFELIQIANIPERQRQQAEVGQRAAERLFEQLNNVLEISQIETGALELHVECVDLHAMVETLGVGLEGMVRQSQHDLEVKVTVAPGVPQQVVVDSMRLTQVMTNLLDNAVKYTERGMVALAVRPSTNGGVVLSVQDSGPGIPPGDRRKIFDRYQRAEGLHLLPEGGMGLGLNIVRELVLLMGFEISVSDTPAGGATFEVTLPPEVVLGRAGSSTTAPNNSPAVGNNSARPGQILAATSGASAAARAGLQSGRAGAAAYVVTKAARTAESAGLQAAPQ